MLHSTTRLIQVNVIVKDRHGAPVRDLKKEDFTVTDNGKPQQISVFSMDSNALLPQAAALPPNVFTNRLQQKSEVPGSVTVILIDALNTNFSDQAYARAQVIKYLGTIHPEDRVAIYALGHGLRVLHDFTTDSSGLLRQLGKYNGAVLPETAASEGTSFVDGTAMQFDSWMAGRGVSRQESDFYMLNRVDGTLRALEFIANHLASLPGRKNLIWVSGGFPLSIGLNGVHAFEDPAREHRTFGPDIERAVRTLNDANVAVYPVDSRGLMVDPRFSAANRGVDLRPGAGRGVGPGVGVEHQQTMSLLADSTGGHAYYNTNDLAKAIRDAVDDSALTYTLGFYPVGEKNDGKFHKIEVKTPEHGGLNFHFRKGYFDIEEKPMDVKARHVELQDAVWSPLDSSALGMLVQLAPEDAAHPGELNLYVKIDPNGFGVTLNGDRRDASLDVLFVQKNDQGRQFNGQDDTVQLALKPESYAKVEREGLVYHQFVKRSAQATMLRVIVRDASSGSMGSVTIPFSQIAK